MASVAPSYKPSAVRLPIDVVEIQDSSTRHLYLCCKRALDCLLAAPLLVAAFPLMLLIALLIKRDSAGPVLFIQERIGVRRRITGGRVSWSLYTFPLYKFRSMVKDADDTPHQDYIRQFREGRANGTCFKLTDDSRITDLGKILRKTSLDELPQLINVLRGHMSLVGPRPALAYELELYDDVHYERFCVMPGITGLWQATARSQVPFQEMIQMDVQYARATSLWLDIKLLLLTIPAVLSCRGAA